MYDDGRCRVVIADEPFAGFCRVIWNAHVREMTDLALADREHLMRIVFRVEAALRALLEPHKINLASLAISFRICIGMSFPVSRTTRIFRIRFGVRRSARRPNARFH